MAPHKVELHLYDLSNGLAGQLSLQLTGKYIPAIWHSSIVCYGVETYFGQGIQQCQPGRSHHGVAMKVVPLGETHIDKETFDDYIQSLREVYTAESYHLLEWNCNTFTNDVAGFLTGGQIPQDVIDLPKEFLSTPFGQALRPQIDAMFRRSAQPGTSLPPPGANGAASAFMNHVARTVQQPTPYTNGTRHSEDSITSSLSMATNVASFNSILSSNKCVAVMFTGEHCGPCRTIKPTFESLAMRKKDDPPVSFVLVDTNAGREVAAKYNISAVPTFKFFLNGKEQYEFKGADTRELDTQVDLLVMSGFPTHPHTKLKLPALRALSLSPILYEQKPNFDAAIAKLETFEIAGSTKPILDKAKPHLNSLSDASKLSQSDIITIFQEVDILLQSLEAGQCFPLFDILKCAVLQPEVAELAAESLTKEDNIVSNILIKGTSEGLNRSSQITLLRLLCNCFSNQILAARLLSEHRARDKVASILVRALLEEDNTIRVAAGSLAYNVACWLRKQRHSWIDDRASDEEGYSEREEFEIELCTAILEALEREESIDVAHRLLASLGQLLLFSPHFDTALSPILEALEAKRIVQNKRGVLEKNAEAMKLVGEIGNLVEST